ncbi:S-layer homology domain-containing protein [Thermovorax subterraneus]|nr:S-layer homology domain-containing protein [Thermovorax subterraneus]
MKRFKKSLVTLLVLVFVLSIMSTGFAAVTESSTSVVRAKALGILKGDEKGNLNLDKPITRAEAVTLIVRLLGLEKSAELMKGQTQFKDVGANHWASGYINVGVGQGVLNGYPDGTFKPENNVTYAEMAKMLLYAMNYGVTVQGAPWPSGVMAKADDLGIFDGVNAVPNVPAVRGDVVQMIDNSLTIKHLKQTGYGDLKQYEESDTTFLSKMDVEEIDGRVTAVDVKDKEVTIDPDDENLKTKTYTLLDEEIDIESLLGVEVTVWVNDDDEIFFIDPNMDDVKVDIVDADVVADADEIDLKLADDSFDIAKDVKVYINGAKADLDDLKAGMYGYFVFDDDEIVYINVKEWNKVDAGVVTEVNAKDKIITYFDETGSEEEIDLDDPDDGYVITLDGKKIDLDDIEKNDVIYVADYDDVYHILVVRKTVEGKVERVKDEEVKISGKVYDVSDKATYSLNEDEDIAVFSADAVTDMTGENALAILDLAGELRHITSDVEATSKDIYGVLTKVDTYNEVVKIFANGESKSYEIDGDIYEGDDTTATTLGWDGLKGYTDGTNGNYAIVKFALNKDGAIEDLFVLAGYKDGAATFEKDNSAYTTLATVTDFDEDHDVIKAGSSYFVTSTTTIIDEISDMDVVKWDDIKEKSIPSPSTVKAIIVENDKSEAQLVVFVQDFNKIAEDEELGVVLDKFVEDGDWKATVKVYDGEEKDYVLNSKNDVEIGQVIRFKVGTDNELTNITKVVYESSSNVVTGFDVQGLVTKKDGNYLTVAGGVYRVDSLTLIYDVSGDDVLGDIDEATLSDIKANKTNVGLVVDGKVIKVLYILGETSTSAVTNWTMTVTDLTGDGFKVELTKPSDKAFSDYAVAVYEGSTLKAIKTADATVTFGSTDGVTKGKIYTVRLVKRADLSVILEKNVADID